MLRTLPGPEPCVKSHVSSDCCTVKILSLGPLRALKEKRQQLSWCADPFEARRCVPPAPPHLVWQPRGPSWLLAPRLLSSFTHQLCARPALRADDGLQVSVLHKPREQGLPFGDLHRASPVHVALWHFIYSSQLLNGIISICVNRGSGSTVIYQVAQQVHTHGRGRIQTQTRGLRSLPTTTPCFPISSSGPRMAGPPRHLYNGLTPSLLKRATLPTDPLVPPMTLRCVQFKSIIH